MNEGFESFVEEEKLPVYNIKHRAFHFAKEVVLFVGQMKFDRIYFSLFDQLVRSSTSIGANLVEGMAGVSTKDFVNYNAIALKSANETKYWLCLIKEISIVDKNKIDEFIKEADEISRIVAKIIINTKRNQ